MSLLLHWPCFMTSRLRCGSCRGEWFCEIKKHCFVYCQTRDLLVKTQQAHGEVLLTCGSGMAQIKSSCCTWCNKQRVLHVRVHSAHATQQTGPVVVTTAAQLTNSNHKHPMTKLEDWCPNLKTKKQQKQLKSMTVPIYKSMSDVGVNPSSGTLYSSREKQVGCWGWNWGLHFSCSICYTVLHLEEHWTTLLAIQGLFTDDITLSPAV